MSEYQHARRLIDDLDRIERQIRGERELRPGWKDAFVAFVAAFDIGPVSDLLESRKRVKALERERDRLTSVGPAATPGVD